MHNKHVRAEESPQVRKNTHFQHSLKMNVWAATLGNELPGFHILPGNLTKSMYNDFPSTRLIGMLDNIPLTRRHIVLFIHDRAPPHISRQWWRQLNPINWSPRWPEFNPNNPMDFIVWSKLNKKFIPSQRWKILHLCIRINGGHFEVWRYALYVK